MDGMRLSRFVVPVDLEELGEGPGLLLFNTLNHAMAETTMHVWEHLKELPSTAADIPENLVAEFSKSGLLTAGGVDETAIATYELSRRTYNPTAVFMTLLVSNQCNFSCAYCYQGELIRQRPTIMSQQTCMDVWSFVKWFMDTRIPYHIDVDFFGGEPLLNLSAIAFFAERLAAYAQGCGARIRYSICTNGSLLNKRACQELAQWQPLVVQVSLDGPESIHDRRRPFASGEGSFRSVIEGIETVLDLTPAVVVVAATVDKHNLPHFPEFLDFLASRFDAFRERIIFACCGTTDTGCSPFTAAYGITEEAKAKEVYRVLKLAYDRRLQIARRMGHGICRLASDNNLVIDATGDIYKCISGVGVSEFYVGSVCDDRQSLARRWASCVGKQSWQNLQCMRCAYLPACAGGCRYLSYLRNTERFCLYPLWKYAIGTMRLMALQRRARVGTVERRASFGGVNAGSGS